VLAELGLTRVVLLVVHLVLLGCLPLPFPARPA
jgi:hypothetical protein